MSSTNKTITFGIPCYNSAEYMDKCILSILEGSDYADDVQIVIVDDGSTKDETPAKADEWQARYPNNIKAVHQENGGHGMAVMKAVANADGAYFKNIDSDDWADGDALKALLAQLRRFIEMDERSTWFSPTTSTSTSRTIPVTSLIIARCSPWARSSHGRTWATSR